MGVKSVAFCYRRLRLDFRYAPLATELVLVSRCNMSRRATSGLMHRSMTHGATGAFPDGAATRKRGEEISRSAQPWRSRKWRLP